MFFSIFLKNIQIYIKKFENFFKNYKIVEIKQNLNFEKI